MGHLISSLTKEGDNASVNSTCAQPPPPPPPPPPPGHFGAFARHVSPGGGAFANFALPGTIPKLGANGMD